MSTYFYVNRSRESNKSGLESKSGQGEKPTKSDRSEERERSKKSEGLRRGEKEQMGGGDGELKATIIPRYKQSQDPKFKKWYKQKGRMRAIEKNKKNRKRLKKYKFLKHRLGDLEIRNKKLKDDVQYFDNKVADLYRRKNKWKTRFKGNKKKKSPKAFIDEYSDRDYNAYEPELQTPESSRGFYDPLYLN